MTGTLKTAFFLALLTSVLVLLGRALGGQTGMIIGLGVGLATNLFSYWFSDKIVLRMYGAQEVSAYDEPRLYAVVARLAQRAQMPMPKVYLIDSPMPNAFATGRDPRHAAVAATTGILGLLTDDELSGVMAHELGHVKHRDTLISTVAASIASAIGFVGHMLQWGAMFGMGRSDEDDRGGALGALAMAILAPIAAMLIQLAISRGREYMADEYGARLHGNPLALARALAKLEGGTRMAHLPVTAGTTATAHLFIVNPLSGRGLAGLFSTHPPIEERIARLEGMVGRR